MWKKILAGLLIVLGLILVFSNQISDYYIKRKQVKLNEVANNVSAEVLEENRTSSLPSSQTQNLYDFNQVRPLGINASVEELLKKKDENHKFAEDYMIGILRVPEIKMDIAILRGVLNDNLLLGCGTVRDDQKMGEGNYTLAGHLNRHDGVLFNRVPQINNGSLMYITDKYKIYVYKVYNQITVDETALDMIEDGIAIDRGKPVLSLMTCYLNGESGKRIFVQGELVEIREYTQKDFDSLIRHN